MAFSSWRTWTTGEIVTAAHMNQEVRDNGEALFPDEVMANAWTPTLEGSTSDASGGSVTGREWTVGALQFVWVRFVISEPSPPTGTFLVTLPTAASGVTANGTSGQAVGSWVGRDASATNTFSGSVHLRSSTTVGFSLSDATSGATALTDSAPFTWTDSDVLSFQAVYPIA